MGYDAQMLQLRGRERRLRALIAQTASRMSRDGRHDEAQSLIEQMDRILTTDPAPDDFVHAAPPDVGRGGGGGGSHDASSMDTSVGRGGAHGGGGAVDFERRVIMGGGGEKPGR